MSLLVAIAMAAMPSGVVLAATTIGNNVSIGGTLAVTGATTLTGAATLSALGTLSSGFISNASSSVGAGLQVAGALNASSTFQVAGATVLAGAASLSSTLTVTGVTLASGNLNASSSVFLSGVATSTASTFTVGSRADFVGGFISNASSSVSALNSATLAVGGASTLTGLSTLTGGFISNASSSVGADLQVAGALNASGTALFGGNLLPSGNNNKNIGAFGTAFQNIYASSSLFAASSTINNATATSTEYIFSNTANRGGQLVLKAYNGTCYAVYIGLFNDGALGVTSTALSTCY